MAENPAEPDEGAPSSADEPTGTAADAHDLAERLADVHRRTADLAERVASFQAATTELAGSLGTEPNGVDEPGGDSADPQPAAKRRPTPVPRRDAEPADAAVGEPTAGTDAPRRPRPGP